MGNNVREHVDSLFTQPVRELDRWARFVRTQGQLWKFCWRRLGEHNFTAMSAALSFRTIFALIPVLVFAFLVLQSVGVIEDNKESLRQFLDMSGLTQVVAARDSVGPRNQAGADTSESPTQSPGSEGDTAVFSVAEKIEEIFAGVEEKLTFARLGPVGGALLIWTAITLLTTMEHSLNRIFGAPRGRSIPKRIILYWSVLTLGPVALSLAAYAGNTITERFEGLPGIGWLLVTVGYVGPAVVGILVIAAIYKLLPNTRVRYRAAISGGVIAVPLWLLARWGFSVYVQQLVVKGNLYGVLGVLPLFLIWLNLSWMIFLFGAELAHTATNLKRIAQLEQMDQAWLGASDVLVVALAVAHRFQAGAGAIDVDGVAEAVGLPPELTKRVLERLEDQGLIRAVDEEAYLPAKSPDAITVADVLRAADPRGMGAESEADADLAMALSRVGEDILSVSRERTLGELVRRNPPVPATESVPT